VKAIVVIARFEIAIPNANAGDFIPAPVAPVTTPTMNPPTKVKRNTINTSRITRFQLNPSVGGATGSGGGFGGIAGGAPGGLGGRGSISVSKAECAGRHKILPKQILVASAQIFRMGPASVTSKDLIMRKLLSLLVCVGIATAPFAARAADEDSLGSLVAVLKNANDAQLELDILRGISAALKGRRSVPMPAGWSDVESKLTASKNAEISTLAQSLGLTFGSQKALSALREMALNSKADLAARRSAIQSLLSVKDSALPEILQKLLKTPDLRGEALRGLAGYDDPAAAPAILAVYPQLSRSEKRDALNTLASRAAFAKPFLGAIEENKISSRDLTAEVVRQLRNLKNREIDQQLQKVWGQFHEVSADKKAEIAKYTNVYRAGGSTPGDASRGRAVFAKTCQQCHTLFDTGGKVGPDLTGSNRSDLGYILENMVDPNAVIPNDYRTSTIDMKDDRVITGIIKQQDANSLTVVTANEQLVIPRNEVNKIQNSEISMMPEGLLANLTDQEVRDLIYYLGRPGQVPLPADAK
jgi:putative heme-binding domain-containing protein